MVGPPFFHVSGLSAHHHDGRTEGREGKGDGTHVPFQVPTAVFRLLLPLPSLPLSNSAGEVDATVEGGKRRRRRNPRAKSTPKGEKKKEVESPPLFSLLLCARLFMTKGLLGKKEREEEGTDGP